MDRITEIIEESAGVVAGLAGAAGQLAAVADRIAQTFRRGGKLLICGNGGSAADAQHVAGELVGRFGRERPGWPAIALTANTSVLTALGNDYGYEAVFARQVQALAGPGDLLVGISTSGNAGNVLRAVEAARTVGCFSIGFTGRTGGRLATAVDLCLSAPSDKTPRIQEAHIVAWHVICELVEATLTDGAAPP